MIQKLAIPLTLMSLLLILPSCDSPEKQAANPPESSDVPRKTTRVDRPSRDVPGTRDKLRAALQDARAKAPGEDRETALAQVARNALHTAPDIASEAIIDMQSGSDEKSGLIEAYLRKLLEEGKTEEASAWADALGNERETALARSMLAELLSASNPEQAASLLAPASFTASGVDPSAAQVLQNWVAVDPMRAAEWAAKLPAGDARNAGLKVLLASWVSIDAATAFSWVASQRNTLTRQAALDAVVSSMHDLPEPIRNAQLENADEAIQEEISRRIEELTQAEKSTEEVEPPEELDSSIQPEPEPQSSPEHEPEPLEPEP